MTYEVGDRVRARYGVITDGYDLSEKIGLIKSVDSYIRVYFPEFNKEFKMLRYEICREDRATLEDLQELFAE